MSKCHDHHYQWVVSFPLTLSFCRHSRIAKLFLASLHVLLMSSLQSSSSASLTAALFLLPPPAPPGAAAAAADCKDCGCCMSFLSPLPVPSTPPTTPTVTTTTTHTPTNALIAARVTLGWVQKKVQNGGGGLSHVLLLLVPGWLCWRSLW